MGLEMVELVMEVEDVFGITIPDNRAAEMQTVGDVFDFIQEREIAMTASKETCVSAATFYALRRAISRRVSVDTRIRPEDCPNDILPQKHRQSKWLHIEDELMLRLPPLRRPVWAKLLGCGLWISLSVIVFRCIEPSYGLISGVAMAGFASSIFITIWLQLTERLACLPESKTFSALTKDIIELNPCLDKEKFDVADANVTWNTLLDVVSEYFEVDRNELNRDTHFVYDLNAG